MLTHSCVFALPACAVPAASLGRGAVWAWALSLPTPWAEDLGYVSCPVPGQLLSWTRVCDLWGFNLW